MEDITVVTKYVLNATKEKDIDVVLTMDGYSWTINGKDIDLKVTASAYDGEFGIKAVLKLNGGKEFAIQYGNLSLTFNHVSDCVIVFDSQTHDKKPVFSAQTGDTTTIMADVVTIALSVFGLMLPKKDINLIFQYYPIKYCIIFLLTNYWRQQKIKS